MTTATPQSGDPPPPQRRKGKKGAAVQRKRETLAAMKPGEWVRLPDATMEERDRWRYAAASAGIAAKTYFDGEFLIVVRN